MKIQNEYRKNRKNRKSRENKEHIVDLFSKRRVSDNTNITKIIPTNISYKVDYDIRHNPGVYEALQKAISRFNNGDWGLVQEKLKNYSDENRRAQKNAEVGIYDSPKGDILIVKSFNPDTMYIAYLDDL